MLLQSQSAPPPPGPPPTTGPGGSSTDMVPPTRVPPANTPEIPVVEGGTRSPPLDLQNTASPAPGAMELQQQGDVGDQAGGPLPQAPCTGPEAEPSPPQASPNGVALSPAEGVEAGVDIGDQQQMGDGPERRGNVLDVNLGYIHTGEQGLHDMD